MYAVLPPTYDNGGQIVFPLADFAGMDFLVPSQGFEKDIMRIFKPVANAPHFQPTNLDDHALINLVAHDLGVTMLTELTLRSRAANVQTFPVFPPAWRELGIAIRSLEDASPEVKDFITLTQKTVQELEGS